MVPNVGGVLGIHSPILESWVCRPGEEGGIGGSHVGGVCIHSPALRVGVRPGEEGGGAEMTDPQGSQRGIGYTLTEP